MGKNVAVIGAGSSGLVALKTLQESGHKAVCFELKSDIGGLWNYDLHTNEQGETQGYVDLTNDAVKPIQSSYKSLQFITESQTNMFSAFVPQDMEHYKANKCMYPNEYLDYLKKFAEFYNLYRYINFNSHVIQIQKSDSTLGHWIVTYKRNEKQYEELFDFVFVASGKYTFPKRPQIENIDKFKGLIIHSSQVRNEEVLFPGKSVLVVGGQFSGSDMIVNALKHRARKIYWTVGQNWEANQWCLDRFVSTVKSEQQKQHWQAFVTRHNLHDSNIISIAAKYLLSLRQRNTNEYPMPGDYFAFTDSTLLRQAVQNKQIIYVPTILSVSKNGQSIEFVDKSSPSDVDIIIFATGFTRRFPFLNNIWSTNDQCSSMLYKHVICPRKELDGIAFIGCVHGPFALSTVTEMQCKWLCNTMLVKNYKPGGILYNELERAHMQSYNGDVITNPFQYLDGLYSDMGYKVPGFQELLKRNEIELAVALYHGPLTGMQYLLHDPKDPSFKKAKNRLITITKVFMQEKFQQLVEKYSNGCNIYNSKL